jgi:hypothetical protein
MRTVSYTGDILEGIANELDLDLAAPDWDNPHARKFANSATKWARIGWRWWHAGFPELTLTEQRALRPLYAEDRAYDAGDEVYKLLPGDDTGNAGSYLRAKADLAAGPFDETQWDAVPRPDPYLAYDQVGKQYMGEVLSVDPVDPRLAAGSSRPWPFYPESRGIRLPVGAFPTIWVTFRTRPSLFTADQYNPQRAYRKRSLVYDPDSGECFLAATELAAGVAITNSAWIWQPVPFVLAEFIRMHSAADASEDAAEKADFRLQANNAIAGEVDRLAEQGAPPARWGGTLPARRDPGLVPETVFSLVPQVIS